MAKTTYTDDEKKLKELWKSTGKYIEWDVDEEDCRGNQIEYDSRCHIIYRTSTCFEGYWHDDVVTILEWMEPSEHGSFDDLLKYLKKHHISVWEIVAGLSSDEDEEDDEDED